MATTTGKSIEQLNAELDSLKSTMSAEDFNTSKKAGKIIDQLKVLQPQNYGTETVANAQQKLSTSTQPLATISPNMAGNGTSGMSGVSGLNLDAMYNDYFNSPDINAKKKEVSAAEAARDAAIGEIQNNPWFSQATRGGKIAAIKSDAERNLARISNELSRLQTDAQIKYNIKMDQYNINRQEYQDSINLFNSLITSGALSTASGSDIAQLSTKIGIPTNMINGIIQTAQTKNLTLQTYDDGNAQYILAVDPAGNIANKTYVGTSKSSNQDGDLSKYLPLILGANSNNTASGLLPAPQMSANPGQEVEYPVGSGNYWTMDANGVWR